MPNPILIERDDLKLLLITAIQMRERLKRITETILDDTAKQIVLERITSLDDVVKRTDELLYT